MEARIQLVISWAALVATSAEHAVVFDAGSTGTRVHVVSYEAVPHAEMPAITHLATSKAEPGLSAFARSPDDASASVMPLLQFAERHVAEAERARTPLMLYGTAGMRLLSVADQRRVYASVRRACEQSGFRVIERSFVTLSGEDEGFFGLLALMWLHVTATAPATTLTAAAAEPPAGILDLGGGSTQIAFPLSAATAATAAGETGETIEAASAHEVRLHGTAVPVFSRSHLGFGNRAALRQIEQLLIERARASAAAESDASGAADVRNAASGPAASESVGAGRDGAAEGAGGRAGAGVPTVVRNPCFHRGYNYTSGSYLFIGAASGESDLFTGGARGGSAPLRAQPSSAQGSSAENDECAQLVSCLFDCSSDACGATARVGGLSTLDAGRTLATPASKFARGHRRLLPGAHGPGVPRGAAAPQPCARAVPFARGVRPPRGLRFFGLSAMFYIANYLAFKDSRLALLRTPSLADLRAATASVCALPWSAVRAAARDPFTPAHKLPQRCFDAHYMLALLVRGFGFDERSDQITFAEKVGIGQPEWPYGAVLHELLRSGAIRTPQGQEQQSAASARALRAGGAAAALALALLLLVALACLRRRDARHAGSRRLASAAPCPYVRALVDASSGLNSGSRRPRPMSSYYRSSKHSGTNSDASDGEQEAGGADELRYGFGCAPAFDQGPSCPSSPGSCRAV